MNRSRLPKRRPTRLYPNRVLYIRGDVNYCYLYLTTGEVRLMAHTLKWYESRWASFVRVHKGVLINPLYATSIHLAPRLRENSHVVMADAATLAISRRRLLEVRQQLPQVRYG